MNSVALDTGDASAHDAKTGGESMDHAVRSPGGAVAASDTLLVGTERSELLAVAYQGHGQAVLRVASRICGTAMAEEVTQEVFVQLWRHPERFDPTRGTLRAYLVTLARGKAVDAVRAERSRRGRERRSDDRVSGSGANDVDLRLLEEERAAWIAEAIGRLPRPEREALTVAFYWQCTYQEAAAMLCQPEGTTKSRIRAALRRLGAALADSEIEDQASVS